MTRKPLTPAQDAALTRVQELTARRKAELPFIAREVRAEIARRMAAFDQAYALSIRRAAESGISLIRIHQDGMGTTSRATLDKWLAKTEPMAAILAGATPDAFTVLEDGSVRVYLPGYETTAAGPSDYPEILEGIVTRDDAGRWRVLTDPGSTGDLPGWLTWEIESGATLPAQLDAWREAQE